MWLIFMDVSEMSLTGEVSMIWVHIFISPFMMNYNHFDDPLAFNLVPSSGQNFRTYDKTICKSNTFQRQIYFVLSAI